MQKLKAMGMKAMGVPEIKQKVYAATSHTEKWGPTGTQMREIAAASHSYEDFPLIMEAIWERLGSPGKYHRHVYKVWTRRAKKTKTLFSFFFFFFSFFFLIFFLLFFFFLPLLSALVVVVARLFNQEWCGSSGS
jgi:ENTH domain